MVVTCNIPDTAAPSPKTKKTNWDNTNSLKRGEKKDTCSNCGKQEMTMTDESGECVECQGLIGDNSKGALKERNPIRRNYRDEDEMDGDHPAAEEEGFKFHSEV